MYNHPNIQIMLIYFSVNHKSKNISTKYKHKTLTHLLIKKKKLFRYYLRYHSVIT